MSASEYYTIAPERLAEIARAAGLDAGRARGYLLADWREGADHQRWIDEAPAEEVAGWLLAQVADWPDDETESDLHREWRP